MMMDLVEQIALYLNDNGVGVYDATGYGGNIFDNAYPANPDETIAIYNTGGPPGDRKKEYRTHGIQIIIRSVPYDSRQAKDKAKQIIDLLNGFNSDYFTDGGDWVVDVEAVQGSPNRIGQDENERHEFSQNFLIETTY